MPIRRKPGELLEVDWAGFTLSINNCATGEKLTVYVFVATFPYSQYSYVEGIVGFASRQIIAALRHYQCFDISDLN